jgi:anti-sigma factor RsiW
MTQAIHTTSESLSAYIDGELTPDRAREVAEHLTTCAQCSTEYETLLATVAALRANLERYEAPDVLRARVRTAIAGTPSVAAEGREHPKSAASGRRGWGWRAGIAAALLVSAALGSGVTMLATRERIATADVATEVLASHVRSLMPDHLTDVRSSDQHNVKPWFNGRLDYSPTVPRLEDQGFPLVGGRVDYVGGRPVAVIVYSRRQHMINVFSWPTRLGDSPLATTSTNGYNMIHWRSHGVEKWVVSDLNSSELRSFVDLLLSS